MTDPTRLGKYDITGVLGKGAMGVVYSGVDNRLRRDVAIKTILKTKVADDELAADYSKRFEREAQAVARLNHPNIVTVFDFGEEGDIAYLVMEFIRGHELKQYFDQNKTFPLLVAVRMVCELLDALEHAHANGIIHRDVKPANVMVDGQGRVKLTDFGVARINKPGEGTVDGTRQVGTQAYMSPEQVKGLPINARADIFAAGVILYQLLVHKTPFAGSEWEIQTKIVGEDPPWPSTLHPEVSAHFDAIVAKALAKQAKDRYASAQEFAQDLRAALERDVPAADASDETVFMSPVALDAELETPTGLSNTGMRTGAGRTNAPTRGPSEAAEIEFWRSITDSTDAEDYELYLTKFPNGTYVELAQRRVAKFGGSVSGSVSSPSAAPVTAAELMARQKQTEDEARRLGEEARRQAEQEAAKRKLEEEQARRAAVDARKRAEAEAEARRQAEAEVKRQAEAEAKRKLEQEQARLAAEEAKTRAEAEAEVKRKLEQEQDRLAAEEAKKRAEAEAEAKRQAEAEAEAEAKRKAEEEARRQAPVVTLPPQTLGTELQPFAIDQIIGESLAAETLAADSPADESEVTRAAPMHPIVHAQTPPRTNEAARATTIGKKRLPVAIGALAALVVLAGVGHAVRGTLLAEAVSKEEVVRLQGEAKSLQEQIAVSQRDVHTAAVDAKRDVEKAEAKYRAATNDEDKLRLWIMHAKAEELALNAVAVDEQFMKALEASEGLANLDGKLAATEALLRTNDLEGAARGFKVVLDALIALKAVPDATRRELAQKRESAVRALEGRRASPKHDCTAPTVWSVKGDVLQVAIPGKALAQEQIVKVTNAGVTTVDLSAEQRGRAFRYQFNDATLSVKVLGEEGVESKFSRCP